jgi:hypothetical protein
MGYTGSSPTVAEQLSLAGFATEVITRNSIFDGSLPGVGRGFQINTRPLSPRSTGWHPMALMLALSKPRFRRQILTTGFFHPRQRENRHFLTEFARATLPADRLALTHALERMAEYRRRSRSYFLFLNLYDVHAPYCPSAHSLFRPFRSPESVIDNLLAPFVLQHLGSHAYLRPGFRFSARSQAMLRRRYRRAIELMDAKLAEFWSEALSAHLLDDTVMIVTSDHGEAFGEHGLYLHDSSVWQTHLHVPLFVHHPYYAPSAIEDVVSLRNLYELMLRIASGGNPMGTILDSEWRTRNPIAIAEHVASPSARGADPQNRTNLVAAVTVDRKVVVRGNSVEHYDLSTDSDECMPMAAPIEAFLSEARRRGVPSAALESATTYLHQRGNGGRRFRLQASASAMSLLH